MSFHVFLCLLFHDTRAAPTSDASMMSFALNLTYTPLLAIPENTVSTCRLGFSYFTGVTLGTAHQS